MSREGHDYHILPSFRNTPSGVQMLYRSCNRRVWSLGTTVILKESPCDSPSETPWDEKAILDFVALHTSIPVPRVISEWIDSDASLHFLLRDKMPGEPLDALWPSLSWAQKEHIADQTAAYLAELRRLHAPYMGRLNRQPLVDQMLFNVLYPVPQGPFDSADKLWAAMAATLHGQVPQTALDRLGALMPPCEPFTFTHGDLTMGNIIVHDGRVSGLIDWEWSGFAPVWWEYAKFRAGSPRWIDPDWFELLQHRIDPHDAAFAFWDKFHTLALKIETTDPRKQRAGSAVLAELLDEGDDDDDDGCWDGGANSGVPLTEPAGRCI